MTMHHARKSAAKTRSQETGESRRSATAVVRQDRITSRNLVTPKRYVLAGFSGRYPGVRRDEQWLVDVFDATEGNGLPRGLAPFKAPAHSWEAFVQAELNGHSAPLDPVGEAVPLRDYQEPEVGRPAMALRVGAPGYLWAYPTGSGKTAMAVRAVCGLSPRRGRKILVITRLSVIPAWQSAIKTFATDSHRWVVINPERLWRVMRHPRARVHRMPVDAAARLLTQEGISRCDWDAIVVDECHMLANAESQRAQMVRRLAERSDASRAFTLWASATPFTTPQESAYLADLIAFAAKTDPPADLGDYRIWLKGLGLKLNSDERGRWYHRINRLDVTELRALLYEAGVGAAATAMDLGLPAQEREVVAITLSASDRVEYDKAWEEFRRSQGLEVLQGSEPGSYRVEALRKVQKASRLKAPYVARLVVEQVARGFQVVVPMWFVESIDETAVCIFRELKAAGLDSRVVAITGRDAHLREAKRVAFQTGQAKVMVLNALEGINAQAGEANTDGKGTPATSTPRVCVIADVLTGGKRCLQAEGRTQRDGQRAPVIYAYAAATGEQEWMAATFRSLSNTLSLNTNDADAAMFDYLAHQIASRDGV
ncbi:DEAD/DEAH box helicase family protein [Streptomyces melanogenes]|uniref:DEAD/DEAH box helicase family protein n=1 Tax=Streptomyces melanogenes TaxID=67326 RepID=UPI00378A267F